MTGQDCPHAPNCSPARGCCKEFTCVPREWAQLTDRRKGIWVALTWAHPRETVIHRSGKGEPLDQAPKWA